MIIRKGWRRKICRRNSDISKYVYEGWFLLGIFPLYIHRVTVYNK